MTSIIFISPIFLNYILPFVLVFTLVFAILQKTKLLGDESKQVNAIIGLVLGLILIAFPFARDIIVKLMPFLAVSVVVLLIFMLMYGFVWNKQGDVLHKGVKIALGIIIGLAVITAVLWAAGIWNTIYDWLFKRESMQQVWVNIILIVILAGAVIAVVVGKDDNGKKE